MAMPRRVSTAVHHGCQAAARVAFVKGEQDLAKPRAWALARRAYGIAGHVLGFGERLGLHAPVVAGVALHERVLGQLVPAQGAQVSQPS